MYLCGIEPDHLAVEVFRRCRHMLSAYLGVASGAAILAVYDSLAPH